MLFVYCLFAKLNLWKKGRKKCILMQQNKILGNIKVNIPTKATFHIISSNSIVHEGFKSNFIHSSIFNYNTLKIGFVIYDGTFIFFQVLGPKHVGFHLLIPITFFYVVVFITGV